MIIISGKYKRRKLKGFDIKTTRPTMDRVKESLFAMIGNQLVDSVVLDLYSGTGNLAIEALSNGAKEAYLVDNNAVAVKTIKENLKMLDINNAYVIHENAKKALENFINDNKVFDIIFLDPPYHTNELDKSLTKLNDNIKTLSDKGIIVCETELDIDYSKYYNFTIYKTRRYGSKIVTILKKH